MAEEIEHVSSDRQAAWVALRTLRQRPTRVGRTDEGVPVYEIRSVRLVLAPGATHFRRLATCARCERDVPGPPVLGPADLNRPPNLVFCDRCARSAGSASPEVPLARPDPPAPGSPPVARLVTDPSLEAEPDLARRLAIVEARLAEVMSTAPSPLDARDLQRLTEQVADVVGGQSAQQATVSASLAEMRAEMRELGESNRAVGAVQLELDRRMVELVAHVEAQPDAEIKTTLARELADIRASVAAMIDATTEPMHAALAEGLDHVRSEIAFLQQRIDEESAEGLDLTRAEIAAMQQRSRDELAAFAALVEAQRTELTEAMHDVAHETLMAVAEPLRDLTKAREDFERRLESLQQKAQEDQRRLDALNASSSAGASRLHALEQNLHTSARRSTHPANPEGRAVKPAQQVEGRPHGALLDALDRQLREAEERLGQL